MLGRTNTGGGGGGLNFKVVGGTTAPSNPKENTIWINTNTKITSWVFSATEPKSPAAGMVWIIVGTSSTIEINALKKNAVQIYPISAKQYISGKWVDVTAMSYQGGAWKQWKQYLIKDGVVDTSIAAFRAALGVIDPPSGYSSWAAGVAQQDGSIMLSHAAGNRIDTFRSEVMIDVTKYSTICVNVLSMSGELSARLNVANDSKYNGDANAVLSVGINRLDISNIEGKKYINITIWAWAAGNIVFDDLWFE